MRSTVVVTTVLMRHNRALGMLTLINHTYWQNLCDMNAMDVCEGGRLVNHNASSILLLISMFLRHVEARLVIVSRLHPHLVDYGSSVQYDTISI